MKTKSILRTLANVALLFLYYGSSGQQVNLGLTANFTLFTVTGAIDNTAISQISGNIGTNAGSITGFGVVNGGIYNNDATTRQCADDLVAAYAQLISIPPTFTSHAPAYGGGETLFAGVYSIAAAGSIAATINLDAQGDPNAVFIFKFGGAFTTAASATVNLVNGASACNIYWAADGAISMAAGTIMKGTLIANNGAVSMGDGGSLEGRMLSTTGAISVYGVYAYNSCGFTILPVGLKSFSGICSGQTVLLSWQIDGESDNSNFTLQHKIAGEEWQDAVEAAKVDNSLSVRSYQQTDAQPGKGINYYRLKVTDIYGRYKLSNVIAIKACSDDAPTTYNVYPNPSKGKFDLLLSGGTGNVTAVELYNAQGQQVYRSPGYQQHFDLSVHANGIYYLIVRLYSKKIISKIILNK